MRRVSSVWSAGGSLEIEPLAEGADRLEFNVTRCRYAEYFKDMDALNVRRANKYPLAKMLRLAMDGLVSFSFTPLRAAI